MRNAYDYLIVGAGLFGATFARSAAEAGKKCLVVERRPHIGGNAYTETKNGIRVHCYGAHIFHTNNSAVWSFVRQFAEFNSYVHSPIANYRGEIYNLPFNMNTFYAMWGAATPEQARAIIQQQQQDCYTANPENMEQQALNMVGRDIYEKLIKGYTEKQWGRPCSDLPPFIIKRLPLRFTYDNNYFNAKHQGIPAEGYTAMVEKMLDGIEVRLETDYLPDRDLYNRMAGMVIYTGPLDAYFNYSLGALAYRHIRFDTQTLPQPNFQGSAVVNYTDALTPYTRIIEHKHFEFGAQAETVISYEYSEEWRPGMEPYYPLADKPNQALCLRYRELARKETKTLFGGRLGSYQYYDMDQVIEQALNAFQSLRGRDTGA
ncbi:MAG: UDP-galactopyranose mutase [Treponema sp.]|jgi:UDP-galactopyranose mutase|nr:UDP-galactopyranose mutase [Treponema sp.]